MAGTSKDGRGFSRAASQDPGSAQRVRGIIVCRSMSEDLRLACASIKDVELCEYKLSVTVSKVPQLELPT